MMRTRRLAALLGTAVMGLSLVACSDTGTSEPDGSVGKQTPTAPPTDDADTNTDG